MAILKMKTRILTLFLLLSALTAFAVLSKPDIHKILVSYGLPPGLLPADPAYVSFNKENGKFAVGLTSKFCTLDIPGEEAGFMGYGRRISGMISQGNIQQAHGIYMQLYDGWTPAIAIEFNTTTRLVNFLFKKESKTPVDVEYFEEVYPCKPSRGVPLGKEGGGGGGGANHHGIVAAGLAEV